MVRFTRHSPSYGSPWACRCDVTRDCSEWRMWIQLFGVSPSIVITYSFNLYLFFFCFLFKLHKIHGTRVVGVSPCPSGTLTHAVLFLLDSKSIQNRAKIQFSIIVTISSVNVIPTNTTPFWVNEYQRNVQLVVVRRLACFTHKPLLALLFLRCIFFLFTSAAEN